MANGDSVLIPVFWHAMGILGAVIFNGRFYLQWIVSEIKQRSVVPVAFWYMSSVGSVILLAYAFFVQSPVGALSNCFNLVIYARNLVHIWRSRGALSQRASVLLHLVVFAIVAAGVAVAALIWLREVEAPKHAESAAMNWFWIGIGAAGQGIFGCRFLVQWVATEMRKKSVIPMLFWYLSIAAALLVCISYIPRKEWVFAVGAASNLPIYVRNIWLVRRYGEAPADE